MYRSLYQGWPGTGCAEINLAGIVSRLYYACREEGRPISRSDVLKAREVVRHFSPPCDTFDVFVILTALNLLNAAIKQAEGSKYVSYTFIKGQAAKLYVHLAENPCYGVDAFFSRTDDITYFAVFGVQISFHYLPHTRDMRRAINQMTYMPQQWCGMQLQQVATEIFDIGLYVQAYYTFLPHISRIRLPRPKRKRIWVKHGSGMYSRNVWECLEAALHFNIWSSPCFELRRRSGRRYMRAMRYTGNNYDHLMNYLVRKHPMIEFRKEETMEKGKIYHLSPQKRIVTIKPSRHILALTQQSYLRRGRTYCNLLITYQMAVHLAGLFPELTFVNTLNYNRLCVRHQYFDAHALKEVPLESETRYFRCWLVVDPQGLLADFSPVAIPQSIIQDYSLSADPCREFEVIGGQGQLGIRAFYRHTILPCQYRAIRILNYFAYVQNDDRLWAIFALNQERFVTDFLYRRIWYDARNYRICAEQGGLIVEIYDFFPHRSDYQSSAWMG